MNYQQARAYIEEIQRQQAGGYRLDEVTELAERMGRPDRGLRIIHIAGTNGKGSVGAYIANALALSGYTVGRYVSPTLFDYRERIQKLSGNPFGVEVEWIREREVAEQVTELAAAVSRMEASGYGKPTAFELETVMAFSQMVRWQVDVAVIEVGMGGAQDATNIIERPELTVFTAISRDHMEYLGETLEEIADQKLGIIKAGVPVVSVRQDSVVQEKLKGLCRRRGLKLRIAEPEQIVRKIYSLEGTRFVYQGVRFKLSQLGCYQPENAITALEALRQLEKNGFHKINISSIQLALRTTKWPGRFELVSRDPFLFLDGAHNPAGAAALKRSLEIYFPAERFCFIFGVFRDKDYRGILREMYPLASRVYTVRAEGSRGMAPEELARVVREAGIRFGREIPVTGCPNTAAALQEIRRSGRREKILVFGSLSFLKDVYRYFDTEPYIW